VTGDDRGTQVTETPDGPMNQFVANAGTANTGAVLQNSYITEVSHTADGGRSSARQLITDKMQSVNPAAVNNNPPIVNNAGGDAGAAQVAPSAAAANTGSYAFCAIM